MSLFNPFLYTLLNRQTQDPKNRALFISHDTHVIKIYQASPFSLCTKVKRSVHSYAVDRVLASWNSELEKGGSQPGNEASFATLSSQSYTNVEVIQL